MASALTGSGGPVRAGRSAVAQDAAYQIRRLIVSRGLAPGDRLPSERELTTILGVSRTSVRSALTELEAIGLLEISPARGAFVSSDGSAGIQISIRGWLEANRLSLPELIECRRAIESAAAELAAKRRDAADLEAMRALLDEMSAAIEYEDPQRFSEADTQFHGRIGAASNNRLFVAVLDSIAEAIRTYREATARLGTPLLVRSLRDHTAVYDAIVQSDGPAARDAMLHHIVETAIDFHVVAREELA
jgi:GntR family transcriptional repressor for pyruvate dehydrogenase complex